MMNLDIIAAASAISDFINRVADMSEAKTIAVDTGTVMEKSSANYLTAFLTGRNDLCQISITLDEKHSHDFVFELFKEIKTRYFEKGYLISLSTGSALKLDPKGGQGSIITVVLPNA